MYQRFNNPSGTPLSMILIGVCVVIFLLQFTTRSPLFNPLALWPVQSELFYPWQLITYGFLHGSFTHLFFNMFAVYMFGLPLEAGWGKHRFALYFITCVAGAGFVQLLAGLNSPFPYATIGASGGVFGLLLAYGLRYPNNTIMLLIPPIPIKAKYFVWIYGAIELFLGVSGQMPGIAHFAHLGGMMFGLILLWLWGWRPGR